MVHRPARCQQRGIEMGALVNQQQLETTCCRRGHYDCVIYGTQACHALCICGPRIAMDADPSGMFAAAQQYRSPLSSSLMLSASLRSLSLSSSASPTYCVSCNEDHRVPPCSAGECDTALTGQHAIHTTRRGPPC